jgi:hypothetical protein
VRKTEKIYGHGPWKSVEGVEFATSEWVAWCNTQRLLEAPRAFANDGSKRFVGTVTSVQPLATDP